MTNQTNNQKEQTKELVPYDQLKLKIKQDDIQQRFRDLIGQRAPQFLSAVVATVYGDSKLRQCDPDSVLEAAANAAIVNLTVDKEIGQGYLVPYYNSRTKKYRANFQIGYKGYIKLAYNTQQYAALNATPIYQGQAVEIDQLTGEVSLTGTKLSEEVIGYAAYFRLIGGMEKAIYMSNEDIFEHAEKYSRSYQADIKHHTQDSLYLTNFDAAGRKTVLRRLLRWWGVLSTELQSAIEYDKDEYTAVDPQTGEIIDAEAREPTDDDLFTTPKDITDLEPEDDSGEPADTEPERPYPPTYLDGWLTAQTIEYHDRQASKNQRNLLRYCFELALAGQPDKVITDKRYTVCQYLTNEKSTNKIADAYVIAMINDWFEAEKSDDQSGDWTVNPHASQEIEAIYVAATVGEGQQSLDLGKKSE